MIESKDVDHIAMARSLANIIKAGDKDGARTVKAIFGQQGGHRRHT
jgi:hypothetical protein